MGQIAGDLDVLGIANLLQALTMSQCEGFLTFRNGDEEKTLQIDGRGIRLLRTSHRVSPLGEILLRTRKISRPRLDEILLEQPKSGMPLGEFVTRRGVLTRESIDAALKEQVADEIYDVFTWTRGRFEFADAREGAGPEREETLASVTLDQSVMFIALEAARRMDHLARIREVIPGERLIPVVQEIPLRVDDPGLDRDSLAEILPFVDGKRSVAQIIEESLYPKFTVLLLLYAMAQHGALKIRDSGAAEGPETVHFREAPQVGSPFNRRRAVVFFMSTDSAIRLEVSTCLRNLKFEVLECGSEAELRLLSKQGRTDLVLLDVPLESEDSLALCGRLRRTLDAPYVVMTAPAGRKTIANAFLAGARHVFVKPVNLELLAERLCETLEWDQARRAVV